MSFLTLFLIQAAVCAVAYWLLAPKEGLPPELRILTFVTYLTSPVYVAVKGVQSALFPIDFFAPLLMLGLLIGRTRPGSGGRSVWHLLIALLVVLPLMGWVVNALFPSSGFEMTSRQNQATVLWLYRNVVFLGVFAVARRAQLGPEGLRSFLGLNLALALATSLFGLAHYLGFFNLATFEELYFMNDAEKLAEIGSRHFGTGFMGLFRGSVGQWFALLAAMSAAYLGVARSGKEKTLALLLGLASVAIVLMSYSRAGAVALGAMLAWLLVFGKSPRVRGAALIAVAGFAVACLYFDLIAERVQSIVNYGAAGDSNNRFIAWRLALDFLAAKPSVLFFGIGPANLSEVFTITRAYGAHNEYIDVVLRMGIGGLVLVMGLIALLWRRFAQLKDLLPRKDRPIAAFATAAIVGNCLCGLTQEHFLHNYSGYTLGTFIYLFYGALLGVWERARRPLPERRQAPQQLSAQQGWLVLT